jgi:MATE family multidrug resistance protein
MLLFVAFYSLVDAVAIVSFGALKGAGDVFYVMMVIAVAAVCVMILPGLLAVEVLGLGAYTLWGILAVYVLVLGTVFRRRWTSGRWREFKVI